jgi:hypothetical protein
LGDASLRVLGFVAAASEAGFAAVFLAGMSQQ